jgi:hypothetical protein
MSDLMFNEVPLEGKKFYRFGDWKEYAIHDSHLIHGFFGDYRWLSNFHSCPVYFDGLLYPSSENAYQAAKLSPDGIIRRPEDYRPISVVEFFEFMKKKTFKPIDHHRGQHENHNQHST